LNFPLFDLPKNATSAKSSLGNCLKDIAPNIKTHGFLNKEISAIFYLLVDFVCLGMVNPIVLVL
jgi:hypothetical protein